MEIVPLGTWLPNIDSAQGQTVIQTLNSENYHGNNNPMAKYYVHVFCHTENNYSFHYNNHTNLPLDINQLGSYHFIIKEAVVTALEIAGKSSVLSFTLQQHDKLINVLKAETYFNKLCLYYRMESKYTADLGFPNYTNIRCNLYRKNNFFIPSLKQITLIYLHRNTCFSTQKSTTRAKVDYTPQKYIFNRLPLPETVLTHLKMYTKWCQSHKGESKVLQNTVLTPQRFFLRQNSAAKAILTDYANNNPLLRTIQDNESILLGKILLTKAETKLLEKICFKQFQSLPLDLYTQCINSFGMIENYDIYDAFSS